MLGRPRGTSEGTRSGSWPTGVERREGAYVVSVKRWVRAPCRCRRLGGAPDLDRRVSDGGRFVEVVSADQPKAPVLRAGGTAWGVDLAGRSAPTPNRDLEEVRGGR